ncbi:MAG: mevalonate kinase [Candidatus Altiarchaeales archaeon]|nr:MAG: mevalonate kinase [Candidatus Altiarchaeales archaeon]RLI94420.1 MAG: mevalonate kinase [Candidatus Altiarchaeales archaeon]RLI94504.1 MAG: mevalonate kinase [Candidatus Altiarchaeales archaeon]HDO82625.1 mevalonate kinase [Candidatus Altiarchaeales archaeon]HEX55274.1 mevalonate kinase [Candidatus Altiarchaeales archaeon]
MTTKASAPGKIILLGEHAAVYGNPVLVATVDLRSYVTVSKRNDDKFVLNNPAVDVMNFKFEFSDIPRLRKKWNLALSAEAIYKTLRFIEESAGLSIDINSDVPVSSGMGSSASIASALVFAISREMGHNLSKKEIARISWDIENIIHKKSSGVDPYAVTYGGIIRYQSGKCENVRIRECPEITIGNTGIRSDTGEIVSDVMKLKNKFPGFFEKYLEIMKEIVDYGQRFLESGDMEGFGQVMNINHGLLSAIGVSSPELEKLVWASRKKSPGAKLCGAGRGGIMIAIGDVANEIEKVGGQVIKTRISRDGVRLEN